jgi:putative DNA primase/helicase
MTPEGIALGLNGHKAGSGYVACCPAHDDRKPSLSIRLGHDGRILVHCHAGCEQSQVISALELRGLWDRLGRQSCRLANGVHHCLR